MKEHWFRDKFLGIALPCYPESIFVDDISFTCGANQDYDKPARFTGDVIEVDPLGRLHLWLFAPVFSPETVSGATIGRLFAYDRIFAAADPQLIRTRLQAAATRRRYDTRCPWFQRRLARLRPAFDSWNLVICGGSGCELAGAENNLLYQLYAPLSAMIEAVRDVNTWHFYQTDTGFDLRSLWDVASTGRMNPEQRLAAALGRPVPMPSPEDDFDIATKRDLHLKRRKGFHAQGHQAYFAGHRQAAAG